MAAGKEPDNERPHHVQRTKALSESRREREFYRYYEPIQALTDSGPPLCDLHDEAAVQAHRPSSSPDRALTAFCQLGALRLGCRRAMLFFFDSNFAYVLAEATRTLSLQDDSVHEDDDKLWLGHTVIPRGYSICEETVCRLPPDDPSDPDAELCLSHVIADLDKDTQFCGKPYVTDGPKAKFYAGVPITTPKGINIGAYCCLDDTKRDGLAGKGVEFLQDMAKTVMTHLEMVRAKSEHERGTRMITGLSAFIEGASSMQSWEMESERRSYRRVGISTLPAKRLPLNSLLAVSSVAEVSDAATTQSTPSSSSDSVTTKGKDAGETEPTTPEDGTDTSRSQKPRAHQQFTKNLLELQEQLIAPNVRGTFQRAADLVREAIDVDGVAFLDGIPNTYGGLVETHDGSDQSSDALTSSNEQTGTESASRRSDNGRGSEIARKVLASSHIPEDRHNHKGELQHDIQATNITERFLRSLLRRNPHGKIWNFGENGDASSDESSSSERDIRSCASDTQKVSNSDNSDDSGARRAARRRQDRVDDGKEIQSLFPGVRSLALCGMWDQNRSRWFSACAIWTYSPLRLFSQELEVNYMAAFCDVVMAEVYRLEAQNSDKAKSDFISSISHELRSPLHGILGSVECLQEQPSADSFNSDLVSQIEVCGRTLLDIVEHLLDYSKINHSVRAKAPSRETQRPNRKRPALDVARKLQLGGLISLDTDVALDEVTEEVVETAVYSFCCAKPKESILDRKVTVIMDVDRAATVNWQCKVPLGAWKRICINLVSNAMKYTSEGFIHVSLKVEPIPGKRRRFNAVFTVQDTGRGMSRDFLENHLFRAFSQEDNLVEGTGLGMSLVARIVKAMRGKIDVQSEKDAGTTMTVTVPVEVGQWRNDSEPSGAASKTFSGSSIAIVGIHDVDADAKSDDRSGRIKLLHSIRHSCEQLGMNVRRPNEEKESDADVYLIPEQDLGTVAQHKQLYGNTLTRSGLDKPLIIVCNSAVSVMRLRAASVATRFTTQRVEYIAQPCGVERLSKAIKNCLQDASSVRELSTAGEDQATTGAISGISGRPNRPHEHEGIEQRSTNHTLRPELTTRSGADRDQVLHSLAATSLNSTVAGGTSTEKPLPQPPEDYLSARSKSMGDPPTSPQVVELPPRKTAIGDSAKSVPPPGLSLLLVDDNQINLQLLVNYATKQGHRKMTATDGMQAVEAYKSACLASGISNSLSRPPNNNTGTAAGIQNIDTSILQPEKPQVILMDISMPVLNGFEAIRLIRAFEQRHGVRPAHIIALTGLGSASAQQEAFSSGVDLYLTKPVRFRELTKLLGEIRSSGEGRADTPEAR